MDAALRALNRFGLGARQGERRAIDDPRGWLKAQLQGGAPAPSAPVASPGEIGDALRALRMAPAGDEMARRQARRRIAEIGTGYAMAALTERVTTDGPFIERLVAFWTNHLCVSVGSKAIVAPLAGPYERDVVRAHVLGRFEDMVLASAKHPAMLAYLDNFQSIGPASRGAQGLRRAGGQRRGLNENYARELLELHTLGVNGGYSQQDVQELARILTGWTVSGINAPGARLAAAAGGRGRGRARGRLEAPEPGDPVAFLFHDALHEPGAKTVLGQRYAEAGVEEGERAIRALCRHRSTATFVATKLVRHFVADGPPPTAVERVAGAFQKTDGDLAAVARAIVDEPEAWREEHRKFRTPQDWLVAVMRGLGVRELRPNTPAALRQLREPLWSPPSPKGFGDTLQEWADPDSLLNRGELARTLSRHPAVRAVDPPSLLDLVDVAPSDPLHRLLADTSIAPADRAALAIAGPLFQWR